MLTRARSTLILLAATAGLGGCVGMDPYGYGYGTGVSVGYGSGYSPYGYGNYGYGNPYGAYGYGAGYGDPYYGWYDDFYYPGTGYYVYNRSGSRYRWSDAHRRYWESRRGDRRGRDNWSGYRTPQSAIQDWADRANGVTTTNGGTVDGRRAYRQERRSDRQAVRNGTMTREQFRTERETARTERRETRQERRSSRSGSVDLMRSRRDRKAD